MRMVTTFDVWSFTSRHYFKILWITWELSYLTWTPDKASKINFNSYRYRPWIKLRGYFLTWTGVITRKPPTTHIDWTANTRLAMTCVCINTLPDYAPITEGGLRDFRHG